MLGVVVLPQRFIVVLLCLGLIAGNAAVCAGWAAIAEGRMACCTENCPMHEGESHGAGRALTQDQADSCCALSERESSSPSTPTSVAAIPLAVVGPGVVLPASVPALVLSDGWRTVSPIPATPVPRHILLSVFLV